MGALLEDLVPDCRDPSCSLGASLVSSAVERVVGGSLKGSLTPNFTSLVPQPSGPSLHATLSLHVTPPGWETPCQGPSWAPGRPCPRAEAQAP